MSEKVKALRHTDGKANGHGGYVDWHLCPTSRGLTWKPYCSGLCSNHRGDMTEPPNLTLPVGVMPPSRVEPWKPQPREESPVDRLVRIARQAAATTAALLLALATPAAAAEAPTEPDPSPGVGMGFLCTVSQGDDDPHAGCEPAVAVPLYTFAERSGDRHWSLLAAVTEERAGVGVGYCSESACVAAGFVAPWAADRGWEVEEWRFAGGVSVGLRDLLGWVGR